MAKSRKVVPLEGAESKTVKIPETLVWKHRFAEQTIKRSRERLADHVKGLRQGVENAQYEAQRQDFDHLEAHGVRLSDKKTAETPKELLAKWAQLQKKVIDAAKAVLFAEKHSPQAKELAKFERLKAAYEQEACETTGALPDGLDWAKGEATVTTGREYGALKAEFEADLAKLDAKADPAPTESEDNDEGEPAAS